MGRPRVHSPAGGGTRIVNNRRLFWENKVRRRDDKGCRSKAVWYWWHVEECALDKKENTKGKSDQRTAHKHGSDTSLIQDRWQWRDGSIS